MVHTVRRSLREVERGRLRGPGRESPEGTACPRTLRAAGIAHPGVAALATPGQLRIGATRIQRSVPERGADSGP
ncbi:hypothetical protein GCM10009612_03930 [Streptomyces beijiangensis]